ncbi:MAG: hypothetical protein OXU45_01260 [Candidatus Melainabacteria bacterium]|nr:hypothetical protein [Candidatus Melainabacteria bacterium]
MSTPSVNVGVANNRQNAINNSIEGKFGIPQNFYNQVQTGFGNAYSQGQEAYFALQRELIKYQFQSQLYSQLPRAIKEGTELFAGLGKLFGGGSSKGSGDTQIASNNGPCTSCQRGNSTQTWTQEGAEQSTDETGEVDEPTQVDPSNVG